jgi:TolA-binding protein
MDAYQLLLLIAGVCGAIATIYSFYQKFYGEKITQIKSDIIELQDRISELEKKLETDYTALAKQQEINAITLTSINSLLKHAVSGTNIDEMQKCISDINTFLAEKASKL